MPSFKNFFSKYGIFILFFTLILINAFITPNFFRFGTLRNLLLQVYPILIVSIGLTLVISSGGIDISTGAIMAISASVTARLFDMGLGPTSAILCGLIAGSLAGFFNGFVIAKFKVQPIVMTLIVMITGRGLSQIILGELYISFYGTPLADLGNLKVGHTIPVQVLVMIFFGGIIAYIVKSMKLGREIEAIGDNINASRLSGISISQVTIIVYIICGFLSSIAGILESARINAVNAGTLGLGVELEAIAAVAIGGTSFSGGKARILGTIIGALLIQLVTVIVNMNNIQFHYSLVIKALIVVLALYSQKQTNS